VPREREIQVQVHLSSAVSLAEVYGNTIATNVGRRQSLNVWISLFDMRIGLLLIAIMPPFLFSRVWSSRLILQLLTFYL
jgi:hypothetical protein